jgi:hypothetical protein
MVNEQSFYDIEYVSGEFGESYTIVIKNNASNDADISWADGAKLTATKPDGTVLFTATSTDASPLVIASPNVIWPMLEAQTTALSYIGKIDVQVELTSSTTRKRLTKIFKGFIYRNQVP